MDFADNPFAKLSNTNTGFQDNPFNDVLKNIEPVDIKNAKQLMDNPPEDYAGKCQRFVEQAAYGKTGLEYSANTAWQNAQNKVESLNGIKKGDLIYFSPNESNDYDGHVGIYEGNGKFISARDDGIKSDSIDNWRNQTNQIPLGYIPQ